MKILGLILLGLVSVNSFAAQKNAGNTNQAVHCNACDGGATVVADTMKPSAVPARDELKCGVGTVYVPGPPEQCVKADSSAGALKAIQDQNAHP